MVLISATYHPSVFSSCIPCGNPCVTAPPPTMNQVGTKRKLDATEDAHESYVHERQTVYNISMVKLWRKPAQGRRGLQSPSLRHSVLIRNTMRSIENELREEGVRWSPPHKPSLPSLQSSDDDLTLDPRPGAEVSEQATDVVDGGASTTTGCSTEAVDTLPDQDYVALTPQMRNVHIVDPVQTDSLVDMDGADEKCSQSSVVAMEISRTLLPSSSHVSHFSSSASSSSTSSVSSSICSSSSLTQPDCETTVLTDLSNSTHSVSHHSIASTLPDIMSYASVSSCPSAADSSGSDQHRSIMDNLLFNLDKIAPMSNNSFFDLDMTCHTSNSYPSIEATSQQSSSTLPSLPQSVHNSYQQVSAETPVSTGQPNTEQFQHPAMSQELLGDSDLDLPALDLDFFSTLPSNLRLQPLSPEDLLQSLPCTDPFPAMAVSAATSCNPKHDLLSIGDDLDHIMQILVGI